jgi:hypothetical protein
MIVVGGIEYMTTELVSRKRGQKNLECTILALGSYIILNTINPDLLISDPGIDPVDLAVLGEDIPQIPINNTYVSPTGVAVPSGTSWSASGPLASLPAGVTVNPPGDCSSVGQQKCTSIRGLDTSILTTIMANCTTCRPVITGGTEYWLHRTAHRPEKATVDLERIQTLAT